MVTWDDVIAVAPQLANTPLAAQTAILAQVAAQLAPAIWGTRLAVGQVYLAAHLGTIRGAPGYPSETVGAHKRDVSGDITSTSYGREYRRQVRMLPLSRVTVSE